MLGKGDLYYKCPRCASEFTFDETGSTDVFYCRKHTQIKLDRKAASSQDNKCMIVENSRCPSCSAALLLEKLPNNQYYLKCSQCKWNSNQNSPVIVSYQEKQVIKEADRYGLSQKGALCGDKLRVNKGKEFCYKCMIETLKMSAETNFATIQSRFGLIPPEIEEILESMVKNNLIQGQVDKNSQMFLNIEMAKMNQLFADLQSKGALEINEIQREFNVTGDNAKKIMIDLIRKYNLKGTFTIKGTIYYIEAGLNKQIIQIIKQKGAISHRELGQMLDIHEGNVKNYILSLMKNNLINAFFADNGNMTMSVEYLESEVEQYAIANGQFTLSALATQLKIAQELARKTIFNLTQKGIIRGVFTQNHEFITEDALSEKVKAIAKAYRVISINELAKKLAITEQRVEECLANLISRGAIAGYIDMVKKQFNADAVQPETPRTLNQPSSSASSSKSSEDQIPSGPTPTGKVEVVRQYDFVGGQLHFKVITKNNTNMSITSVKVILDVPSSFRRSREMITIPVIDPNNTHGVDFYLEPAECGISTIGGTVLYRDAFGRNNTIHIPPKDVQIKCPLVIKTLDTIEDCYKAIQSLPSDARTFLIADVSSQMTYSAAYRAISQFDTRNVASIEDDKTGSYIAEAWFSSEAKVTGGRIVTRILVNGQNSTLEIRVWCNDPGQLTGFLAKIVELLFVEINMMRKIKGEERNKTLNAMAITRDIMELKDICMLRYKAANAKAKLEDIHIRLASVSCNCDEIKNKIDEWIKKLDGYEGEAHLSDEDADILEKEMEKIQQTIQSQLGA